MVKFVGRNNELQDIHGLLFDNSKNTYNVLVISGEPGIGKTSLAYALSNQVTKEKIFKRIFEKSAYLKSWERLTPELIRDLQIPVPLIFNLSELKDAIVQSAIETPFLLLLDNLTDIDAETIQFIRLWATARKSKLIITCRKVTSNNLPPNCVNYKLGKITKKAVIRDLLGEKVVSLVHDNNMWHKLDQLKGNPQRILYLRWRDPKSVQELKKYIKELSNGETNTSTIEKAIQHMEVPLDHFLALGRVRETEVDEALLAHLWDRLGLGGTALYLQSLQSLLAENLLQQVKDSKLRISVSVHVQLEQLLISSVGERQITNIDYFIGEYYRQLLSKNTDDSHRIQRLENYVYHMLRAGNTQSAYGYVFERGELGIARSKGLSLELERVLDHFLNNCNIWSDQVKSKKLKKNDVARYMIMSISVMMEIGRVYKDLSLYKKCLEVMDDATSLLESNEALNIELLLRNRLKVTINHYKGIAYSQSGRTLDCINAYYESIKTAFDNKIFSPMNALSLGYLAYELKFHDMAESKRIGKKAVELSRSFGERDSLMKNLCSLGQTLSFSGDFNESKTILKQAETECLKKPTNIRELGRVLVNSIVYHIGQREWAEVEKKLDKLDRLYKKSGDRRRMALGKAYRGILLFHQQQQKKGMELLYEAFQRHKEIGAIREMIYEALSYTWMHEKKVLLPDRIISQKRLPPAIKIFAKEIIDNKFDIFVDFWHRYYLPVLLKLDKAPK